MERKFLKWCKKLIPTSRRSTMTNSARHENTSACSVDTMEISAEHENISDCSMNKQQVYPELQQNACTNMEEEVPIEGQSKIEENLDLSTDGCGVLCRSAYTLDKKILSLTSETCLARNAPKFNDKQSIKSLDAGNMIDACGAACVKSITNEREYLQSDVEFFKILQAKLNHSLSEEEVLIIKNEFEIQLDILCPIEFYDFCLITCDADYEEALLFKSKLCKEYNLKGCMLFDPSIANLGGDIFSQYEAMIERSTKVFFYHTENFKKDNVHLRVQNGAVYQQLWEKWRWNREKCVPVFPHGRQKLGLALSGVSGLDVTLPENLSHRVKATFTENVRKFCMLKELDSKQKRSLLYNDLLERILQDYVKRKLSVRQQTLGHQWKLKINGEETSDLSSSTPMMLLGHEIQHEIIKAVTQSITNSEALNEHTTSASESVPKRFLKQETEHEIIKAVTQSFYTNNETNSDTVNEQATSSYKVNISESSDIHVGPRIEVNIHVDASESNHKFSHSVDSVSRTETM